jgi:hypothetical protein
LTIPARPADSSASRALEQVDAGGRVKFSPLAKLALRLAVILTVVTALDATVVMVAPNPRLWATLIPALIPLLTIAFILVPMMRGRRP